MLSIKSFGSFYCVVAFLLNLYSNTVFSGQTTRISVTSNGVQTGSGSTFSGGYSASISADGRYVAFSSRTPNLVPGDVDNSADLFIHDRLTKQITRATGDVGSNGSGYGLAIPQLSADGRYVVFGTVWNYDFVYDRLTHKTERVDVASDGKPGNGITNGNASISADGRYIVFSSNASDLVEGDTNGNSDIFIHDRLAKQTMRIASAKSTHPHNLGQPYEIAALLNPQISADSRYVAFESYIYEVDQALSIKSIDILVHDRQTHKVEKINSVSLRGNTGSPPTPHINADGRYVVFVSDAANLVRGDTNKTIDIFIYDRKTHKTERVSVASNGVQANSTNLSPRISADGRYVAFESNASNLVAGDTNKVADIFVHDRLTHKTEQVSVASSGKHGNNNNYRPNISADGRYVVFSSDASNLVPGDTNKSEDVFVRDRLLDTSHHADLKIAITRRPIFLKPNTQGDYLYTITNNGKDAVKDVSLLHLVSDASTISLTPSQGKCSLSSIETVCHLGKLAVGKKLSLWVQIKAQNKPFNQQVIVSGAPIDTVPGNNQTLVVTYVN